MPMQAQTEVEKAEAMFIYNYARLIQWPAEYQNGNFIIGVLGTTNVYSELVTYTAQKKVGFQAIEIKKFKTAEEVSKCHILFIPFSKTSIIPDVSNKIANYSTLIISEKNGAIELGAAINFMVTGTKLAFELKETNATKYGLKLSTRLKDMAVKVY